MKDERDVPRSDYSVDEILLEEEIRKRREKHAPEPRTKEKRTGGRGDGHSASRAAEEILHSARKALNMEAGGAPAGKPEEKKRPFFHRKKKREDLPPEDDIYYGIQLKSLDEYRRDYEETARLDTQTLRKAEECARQRRLELSAKDVPPAEKTISAAPTSVRQTAEQAEWKGFPQAGTQEEKPEAAAPAGMQAAMETGESAAAPADAAEETASAAFTPAEMQETAVETGENVAAHAKVKAEEAACPEASAPAGEKKTAPAPTGSPLQPDRQKELEKFLRRAELDAEDVFSPGKPVTAPPVAPPTAPSTPVPTVLPGPETTPEQEPEIGIPKEPPGNMPPGKGPEIRGDAAGGSDEAPDSEAERPAEGREERMEPDNPAPIKEPAAPSAVKEETPVPPPENEPAERPPSPRYRADNFPAHVIELDCLDDALAAEAADYVPPVHAPEPIPFPAPEKDRNRAPAEPEAAEAFSGEKAGPSSANGGPQSGNVSPIPVPEHAPELQPAKKRFRLFGSEEDTAVEEEPAPADDEQLDDYDSPEDAPSVGNELASGVRRLALRLAVTGICTAVLAAFSVLWEHPGVLPSALHNLVTEQALLATQLIFLVVAAAFSATAVWNGLQGLFTFQANSDSAAAVAVLATAAQAVAFLFTGIPANSHVYASLAALALFLNAAGKLNMEKRILRNFRFLTSPGQKYAVQTFDDYNTALQMTKGLDFEEPHIVYQTKTGFLRQFLSRSYAADDPSEHVSQLLAPVGFLASLVLCIAAAVISRDAGTALTAFTVSSCVCVPFAGLLSVNLPLSRLANISARCGGMAVGWDAVKRFGGANAMALDAQDLFPRGTVVLTGIQTFAGHRIDDAILGATALTDAVGGTLSDLFSQIVKSRRDILPHVDRPAYEDGLGVSGAVGNRVILVGNAALLKKHGIDAPSRDYEEKYLRAGRVPVYLAAGGVLVAMFLVCYRSDRRRAAELRRVEYNGVSLLVRTRDPNITPDLIADCFGLSSHFISILPDRLGGIYQSLRDEPPERVSASIATKGRATSMMRILTACMRQHGNILIGVALQTAGVALGFALAVFFTACGGLYQLSATALLLFELFWTAAVVLVPRVRRP